MIEIRNLHKSYRRGKEIIPNLNLTLDDSGLTVIAGKSGCGKTTFLNIVGSMDLDFEGNVLVDGKDIKKMSYSEVVDYRNFTSAFVFQKNSLFEFLTVEENLQLCMNIQNNTADISEALEKVGLKGFEHKKVKALSGGEKQRVAIARALIKNCKIIFADEPTSALDTKNAHKIFQLFKEISKDKLVVLVTHDVKKASLYADRMIRFVDGVPVEDIRYNEVLGEAKLLPARKTKKFALTPIFKNNIKKGMAINIFVLLLLVAGITVTNLARAGINVKNEYDYFGTENQVEFNIDRALTTQVKNDINLFNVVKINSDDKVYSYIENSKPINTRLNDADSLIIKEQLKDYEIYEGTKDSRYQTLLINGVSNRKLYSKTVLGINRYWYSLSSAEYEYYLYNENYNYNIVVGRNIDTSNEDEILLTDVVAQKYLKKNSQKYGKTASDEVDYNDIIDEDLYIFSNEAYSDGYYIGTPYKYKVVGVIDTGILDFYTFDSNSATYLFNKELKNVDNDRFATFMNSNKSQPYGYIIVQNHLPSSCDNPFYYDSFNVNSLKAVVDNKQYNILSNSVNSFIGKYDYATNPAEMLDRQLRSINGTHEKYELSGHEDNLLIDKSNRIYAKSTLNHMLVDNEIMISQSMAKTIFPTINFNDALHTKNSFVNIAGREIELRYNCGFGEKSIVVKIVGVTKDFSNGSFYASNDVYKEMYQSKYAQSPSLTVNLDGVDVRERKEIFNNLYKLGYSLSPIEKMPGSYLEFVEGKGETYAEIDGEGLRSLFPNAVFEEKDGLYYFVNDNIVFGFAESEDLTIDTTTGEITAVDKIFMTSTMVKKVALDESYITNYIGNISLYYLFSDYYTFSNTNTGNYILEIMSSMYLFLIGMASLIALGFIYLKENKEKGNYTRLSMLGVRSRHIYLIHFITYFVISIFIVIISILFTYLFVQIINNMFTYSLDSGAVIHRVRLMFTNDVYLVSLIIGLAFFALSTIASILVTFQSRK